MMKSLAEKYSKPKPNLWAQGWVAFAAVIMIIVGIFHAMSGFVALVNDDEFYVAAQEWLFDFNNSVWGWIHLIVGVIVALTGFGLFTGNSKARTAALIIVVTSAVLNFAWLPYYPVWSVLMIALAVTVIWALTTPGSELGD